MVLFATFTAGLGMLLLLNKLPFFGHPVLASKAIASITRDRFALSIEADAGPLEAGAAIEALRAAGATQVEVLPDIDRRPFLTSEYILRSLGGIFASCVVAGLLMYAAVKLFPTLPPMVHMLDQPRLGPQKADAFFKDGRGMQMPVAGTVARGYLPLGVTTQEQAAALVNPLPRTKEVFALGREGFRRRCVVCHGPLANGVGTMTSAYGARPANLQAKMFVDYPDGKIYWVIVKGKNAMPSHAADLSETQRWAIVHYVRALQRAQNAKDEDLMVEGRQ
jgi:mono/diheme cytochrome c family protein